MLKSMMVAPAVLLHPFRSLRDSSLLSLTTLAMALILSYQKSQTKRLAVMLNLNRKLLPTYLA